MNDDDNDDDDNNIGANTIVPSTFDVYGIKSQDNLLFYRHTPQTAQSSNICVQHLRSRETMIVRSYSIAAVVVALLSLPMGAWSFVTQSSSSSLYATTSATTLLHAERVVVTGLGVISGCGVTVPEFYDACLNGVSSIRKVQRFDIQHYPCQIASEVPAEMFDAAAHFSNPKNARSNDRFTHFAVAAARMALKDSGLGDTPETLRNPDRVGVMVGSAFGGMETFEQETLKLATKPERPKVRMFLLSCFARHQVVVLDISPRYDTIHSTTPHNFVLVIHFII